MRVRVRVRECVCCACVYSEVIRDMGSEVSSEVGSEVSNVRKAWFFVLVTYVLPAVTCERTCEKAFF